MADPEGRLIGIPVPEVTEAPLGEGSGGVLFEADVSDIVPDEAAAEPTLPRRLGPSGNRHSALQGWRDDRRSPLTKDPFRRE